MVALFLTWVLWAIMVIHSYAQFSLWPVVGSTQLASALDLSVDCVDSLYEH